LRVTWRGVPHLAALGGAGGDRKERHVGGAEGHGCSFGATDLFCYHGFLPWLLVPAVQVSGKNNGRDAQNFPPSTAANKPPLDRTPNSNF